MSGDASRPGSRRRRSARTFRARLLAATLLPGALVAALAGLGYEDVYRVAELEEAQGVLAATAILMADRVDPADAAALASAARDGRPANPGRVDRVRRELWRQRTVLGRSFDAMYDDPEERLVERTLVDVRLVAPADAPGRGVVALSQDGRRIGDVVDLSAGGAIRPGVAPVAVETRTKEDAGRRTLSAYAPVRDEAGTVVAVVAVDADRAYFWWSRLEAASVGVVVFVVYALVAVPPAWLLARRLARPVRRLREGMDEVGAGRLSIDLEPAGDADFDVLIERFNAMVASLRDHAELRADVAAAAEIQRRLLPRTMPEVDGYQIAARLRYCRGAGGDAYDALALDGRHLLIVGDVSGHGIASALMMASGLAAIRTACRRFGRDLPSALAAVNDQLVEETPPGAFMTLFAASLDPVRHRLHWVNAGHGPALLVRAATGSVERLDSTDVPLGVLAGRPFPAGEATALEVGDVLAVVTDGLHEARDATGRFLGLDAVAERLRELAAERGRTADEIAVALERHGAEHAGHRTPEDDLTVLVLRRSG